MLITDIEGVYIINYEFNVTVPQNDDLTHFGDFLSPNRK